MSGRSAPFSPSARIFRGAKLLTMQVGHSEVKRKSAPKKAKRCVFVLRQRASKTSQLQDTQLESRAMPDTLHPPETQVARSYKSPRLFDWPRQITSAERKSLAAGGLGWMLDAMDVMLYSLVLTYLIREFSMDTRTAGFLNSLTLVASAIGGFLFGILADRIGRTRALMASILVYSFASAACGFSHTIPQLATFRFVLGLGMGGEWTTGAALIAETWRAEHCGKALGLLQSAYAIGEAIAALIVLIVFPRLGWRAVFFVGVLPALLVLWIRRGVSESDIWKNRAAMQKGNWLNRLHADEKNGAP